QLQQHRCQVPAELVVVPGLIDGNQIGTDQQRQQHRQNNQVGSQRQAHSDDSLPSTWSVRVIPREPSISTKYSAVVAKPITIAVSTRAWGKGSAKSAGFG